MVGVNSALALFGLLLCWCAWGAFRPRKSFLDHPAVFFIVAGGAFLALRLPLIKWNLELNPDESQMLAQGMRYLSHPVPWRDVDGTTSGPLNSLLLTLLMFFGAPATWVTARLVLWACGCLTLFFLYLTLRCFGTRAESQFALLPTVFFYGLAYLGDFVHYSSETLSVLLLSICFYLLAREWTADKPAKLRLFLLGLIAGSIPFAKMQAAPLALFPAAIGLGQLAYRHRQDWRDWRKWWREPLALLAGGVAVPCLLIGLVAASGAFKDFWISYILASAQYTHEPLQARIEHEAKLFLAASDASPYLLGMAVTLLLLLWAAAARKVRMGSRLFWPVLVMLADLLLTLAVLVISGQSFWHYLHLLVPPFALLHGLVLFTGRTKLGRRGESVSPAPRKIQAKAAGQPAASGTTLAYSIWLLMFLVFVAGVQCWRLPLYLDNARFYSSHQMGRSFMSQFAGEVARPGENMSVWGWMPSFYVQSGLAPATRDAIGHYVITEGPYQSFFRNRYLTDLEKSRPVIFVDAVAKGTTLWRTWTDADKHESFPELAAFIAQNYSLCLRVQMAEGATPVRFYVLNERLAQLRAASAQQPAGSGTNNIGGN
jgi:hypothetical protein